MQSWKADINKSGGIATKIGVHSFGMLNLIFHELQVNVLTTCRRARLVGF